jgi:choline dehydrogenase-like flavoprotein
MTVVVVGCGAAGSVVAGRLHAAGVDVVAIEAGPSLPLPDALRDSNFRRAEAELDRWWPDRYARGRGVGGSGAVNGHVLERSDLTGWGDMTRWYERAEAAVGAAVFPFGPVTRHCLEAGIPVQPLRLALDEDARRVLPADTHWPFPVRTEVSVERVRVFGARATGVQLVGGEVLAATAVIVCAGAIETPRLLRRSGLDGPAVGTTLADHPSVVLDSGAAAGGATPLITGAARLASDRAIQVMPMETGEVLVALLEPLGLGRVTEDGVDEPGITHPIDRRRLSAGAHEVATQLGVGCDLDRTGAYRHACCSCRDAVDAHGEVHAVSSLWICDASVLPSVPSGGPYLPVIAAAERFTHRWLLTRR